MANEETTQDQITDLPLTTGDPGAAEAADVNASAVVDDELDLDDEPSARVDEELASAQNDEEREAVRERRRAERQARRKHARERREQLEQTVARLERQNSELRQQQEVILSTQHSAQISQLDAAINEAKALAKQYEDIAAEAVSKQDGRTTMEATRRMTLAQERARQLIEYKNRASAATQHKNKAVDPETLQHGMQFFNKHRAWYKGPNSNDADSRIVGVIDAQLASEGWDSNTPDYWAELEKRSARYLPHRFGSTGKNLPNGGDSGYNSGGQTSQRGSPVAGSTRSSVSTAGQRSYNLSAEQVQAIKDAGMWDDPVARERMIKRYRAEAPNYAR